MPHEGSPSAPKPSQEELMRVQEEGLRQKREEELGRLKKDYDSAIPNPNLTMDQKMEIGGRVFQMKKEIAEGAGPLSVEEAQEEAQIVHMIGEELGHEPTPEDYDTLSEEVDKLKVLAAENEAAMDHRVFKLMQKIHVFPQTDFDDSMKSLRVLNTGLISFSDKLVILKKRAQEVEQKSEQKAA